jgi:lipoyl(octanoyl) transferase
VYVNRAQQEPSLNQNRCDKIASLGLRVRRGCSFHGLALNIDRDLTPFNRINPCGYQGLQMTQIADCSAAKPAFDNVAGQLLKQLVSTLGYSSYCLIDH